MSLLRRAVDLFSDTFLGRNKGESLVVESTTDSDYIERLFERKENVDHIESVVINGSSISYIPSNISTFRNLRVLDLSRNKIDELPQSLAQLKKIEILDLSGNKMEKLPWVLFSLVLLKSLNLSHNKLTALPSKLLLLCKLKTLEVTGNNIVNPPKEICERGKDAIFAALRKREKDKRKNVWSKWKPFYDVADDSGVKSLLSLCIDSILYSDIDFKLNSRVPPVLKKYLSEEKELYRPANMPNLHKCGNCRNYFSNQTFFTDHDCVTGIVRHKR